MTGQFNIKKFGFKLLQAAMLAAALVMVDSSSAWAQENAPEGGWNAGSFESYVNENKSNIPTEPRKEQIAPTKENKTLGCKTSAQVRAEVTAGCWSCLVLEKVSSAFLYAAKAGLGVSQKAGVALLILGSAIWLAMWALKNVSSFTEIQLGNILNELFKFLFKVALAYWFISFGPGAISNYFIRPILSVGALIGQQFWDEDIKAYTEDWDYTTEEDQKRLDGEVEKAIEDSQTTPVPQQPTPKDDGLTEEEKKQDEEANKKNNEIFGETEIPNFLIPGVLEAGRISSSYGCRPRPKKGASITHKGIDVTVPNANSRDCVPIVAAGPGTILCKYDSNDKTGKTGYGYYAMITYRAKDGNVWTTVYGHMKAESCEKKSGQVNQGEAIGCMGNTGASTGTHLHFEVRLKGKIDGKSFNGTLDPLSLPAGQLCSTSNMNCDGTGYQNCDSSILKKGNSFKAGGYPAAGKGVMRLNSAENFNTSSRYSSLGTGGSNYTGYGTGGSTALLSDDITYTGPADIIPKSVMNSMLGATRAITNTTAESMIVGRMIMCYSKVKNGGALTVKLFPGDGISIPNFFMWFEGALIWCFGFLLTMAIAYYLMDISFKIGFAVLAMPIMAGLWPFGITQDKLAVAISIIAKSAALFAFLAITTGFGMVLISNAGNFDSDFYTGLDYFAANSDVKNDTLRQTLNDKLYLFSPTFILLLFTFLYVFKMVQKTSSDITNKFFPDKGFGNSSPMHSAATMMTSWAKKVGMSVTGLNYAKDFVAYQGGRLMHGAAKKTVGAVFHPVRTAKNIGSGAKRFGQKVKNAVSKKK